MKYEKAMHDLNAQIATMNTNGEKYVQIFETLDKQIRNLVAQKKKAQAKSKLMEANMKKSKYYN